MVEAAPAGLAVAVVNTLAVLVVGKVLWVKAMLAELFTAVVVEQGLRV
jgi:hypothetical protein